MKSRYIGELKEHFDDLDSGEFEYRPRRASSEKKWWWNGCTSKELESRHLGWLSWFFQVRLDGSGEKGNFLSVFFGKVDVRRNVWVFSSDELSCSWYGKGVSRTFRCFFWKTRIVHPTNDTVDGRNPKQPADRWKVVFLTLFCKGFKHPKWLALGFSSINSTAETLWQPAFLQGLGGFGVWRFFDP